ncbi:hypothetical protein Tco_0554746 [Tanacetum coccineum]
MPNGKIDHYATLVAYPAPFRKYPKPFLNLVGMSRIYTLCEDTYPRNGFACFYSDHRSYKGEVAPDRAESELEASVDRLFEEGGNGNQTEQGDFTGGGQGADIQLVSKAAYTVVEDVTSLQPRRQRKWKTVVRLLAEAVLNAEVRGEVIPTLSFVTSSVSVIPEREGGDHTDSVAETNLQTVNAPQRFVISSESSHHSGATAKEKTAIPSPFVAGSSLAGGTEPIMGGFSDLTGSDFLVGGIRTVIDPNTDIQKFNVGVARQMSLSTEVRMRAEYNIREKRRLKFVVKERAELLKAREKEVKDLKAQLLLKEAEAAEAIRLRAEASKFKDIEKSLQDEVQALKERNTSLEKERDALDVKVTKLETSAMGKDRKLTDLNTQLTSFKSHNDNLVDQVHELEMYSFGLQEKLSGVAKLDADLAEMACHLEEKIYSHLLMTISGRRWLLTHGLKLILVKCLNSSEYLMALGAAISRAIEKGTHDSLAAEIDHDREVRSLADVTAYNPFAGADYTSALQELREVDFSLLAELKSHKDASIEDISPLADVSGMGDMQHDIEQLKVPIHRSEDQVVLGETSLLFALSVSHSRMERIRANIAAERSALLGVWTPLFEPLSVQNLTGKASTSASVPAATITTTTLSTTFASASSIPPITGDDYEIVHADSQESSQGNVQGDTATVEFEKEDLDTTPEHDILN